jgi:prolyl 4-hydroxylase
MESDTLTPEITRLVKTDIRFETVCWSPRIFLLHGFLSAEACQMIIDKANPLLKRSGVVGPEDGKSTIIESRTSTSCFIPRNEYDDLIREIDRRASEFTMLPVENGEALQVVRYQPGQEYKPHHDYFDPSNKGREERLKRGGQRLATLLFYLNDVEEGGETIFPKADIAISPVRGNAILFYNCLPDGSLDPMSLHGGAPVVSGEKWIANKWIHERQFV